MKASAQRADALKIVLKIIMPPIIFDHLPTQDLKPKISFHGNMNTSAPKYGTWPPKVACVRYLPYAFFYTIHY